MRALICFEWKEHVHNLNVETAQVIGVECKFSVKRALRMCEENEMTSQNDEALALEITKPMIRCRSEISGQVWLLKTATSRDDRPHRPTAEPRATYLSIVVRTATGINSATSAITCSPAST